MIRALQLREKRRTKERSGTYNERDDSIHSGILPISPANEGYECG